MRPIAPDTRDVLERQTAPDAMLPFITITHPNLSEPIRAVSDVLDYIWGGNTYVGIPFGFQLLNDDEAAPTTQITVQNVDRRLGQALRSLPGRARVRVDILSSADFDLSVVPRTEIATAAPIYAMQHFELIDITVTATEVSGTLMLRDYSQEPWPGVSATQSRCPGLFR